MVNMNKFKHFLRAAVFDFRVRRAIRKAQRSANQHRRKFLVLLWGGRPRVISMQDVKQLIRQHRFTKGFTAETARQVAIFEAMPQPLDKCRHCSHIFYKRNVSN